MKKNNYNIVLIDDNPAETHFVHFALKQAKLNADLVSARDTDEGIQILSTLKDSPPDLLLIDINMPGSSGFDCLRQLGDLMPLHKLLVVVYSTSNYKVDITKAHENGASHFLVKTDNLDDLSVALSYLLADKDDSTLSKPPLENTLFDFRHISSS